VADFNAIPTEFNGQLYRSRLEADTARLLTLLRIPFEYEAKSYLLPSGVHYWPDFTLYGGVQVLEVRGYQSAKGDAQLIEFARLVASGGLDNRTHMENTHLMFGVLCERPIVEAVTRVKWWTGPHGVMCAPEWDLRLREYKFRVDGPQWMMGFEDDLLESHYATVRGRANEVSILPRVVDGILCIERWQNTAPYDCEYVPLRSIATLDDILAP